MEKKERALKIALIAAVLVFILLIFYTNLFHYNYKMNADIGAEAILGELIWQSKEILPDTWYPSTEARIISTPNIAALFYGMTGNMTLAMGLGCCFMTVLIALAIRFFCKKAGIKETGCQLMGFAAACHIFCGKPFPFLCVAGDFHQYPEWVYQTFYCGSAGYGKDSWIWRIPRFKSDMHVCAWRSGCVYSRGYFVAASSEEKSALCGMGVSDGFCIACCDCFYGCIYNGREHSKVLFYADLWHSVFDSAGL